MSFTVTRTADPPSDWLEFVREHGSFYHDPRWITAIARRFRYPLYCLTARQDRDVAGVLALADVPGLLGPRRLVSFPFSYAAGPAARDARVDALLCSAAVACAQDHGVARVEIKRRGTDRGAADGFERSVRYSTYRITSATGGLGIDAIPSESTRRGIRKAERSAVTVEQERSPGAWLAMARLQERTATRHGVPAPPRPFFTETCRALQHEGLADLYLARSDGRAIAGMVLWKGSHEWIYAFGAARREYLALRPTHALLWAGLRDAAAAGAVFDLGRAATDQEGLVRFKTQWGGQPLALAYDYWPSAAGLNVAPRDRGALALAARVWSLLPVPIARFGSALYRYLG